MAGILLAPKRRMAFVALVSFFFLLRNPVLPNSRLADFPRVVLWAWERPEDLRFLARRAAGVAFLATTVRLSGGATYVLRRRQPLLVDPATPLMAVVRVESVKGARPSLSRGQREAVVEAALAASRLPRVLAVQIDGDAALSEALAFAKASPDDPRAPQLLARAVRATREGCGDGETATLSKAAFQLLHRRYPKSPWAKATKYWFEGRGQAPNASPGPPS